MRFASVESTVSIHVWAGHLILLYIYMQVAAAHSCYLVAELNIDSYSESARICLLGADHLRCPRTFTSPEAIQVLLLYVHFTFCLFVAVHTHTHSLPCIWSCTILVDQIWIVLHLVSSSPLPPIHTEFCRRVWCSELQIGYVAGLSNSDFIVATCLLAFVSGWKFQFLTSGKNICISFMDIIVSHILIFLGY
jgi:hypothetical protein